MDGVRLEDFDPSWLREQLGIVGQEPSTGGYLTKATTSHPYFFFLKHPFMIKLGMIYYFFKPTIAPIYSIYDWGELLSEKLM